MAPTPPLPNRIGRYHVEGFLGGGGMGLVDMAHDPVIDRRVAVKVLRTVIDSGDLRERFGRELKATGRLMHGNIVTVFDAGEHEGQPFIAMEYIDGRTVADIVDRRLPLPLAVRLRFIEDLCSGLAYAHARGLVHRDIKPANLIVARDGALKILDFGIARMIDAGASRVTAVGSPSYMSPEQVLGEGIDHRADVFAVGLVLYELIGYQRAFPGDTLPRIAHAIAFEQPRPLSALVPTVDPRVVATIDRAIAKRVGQRHPDVTSLAAEVSAIRSSLPDPGDVPALVFAGSRKDVTDARPDVLTPRRQAQSASHLAARRSRRVAEACELAETRLAAGDPDGAIAAAEEALILDPESALAQQLVEEARTFKDERQAEAFIDRAGRELDRGAMTDAAALIEEAGSLAPGLAVVAAARERFAAVRRAREEAARRQRELEGALLRSRDALGRGDYTAALEAADTARKLDPTSTEAGRLLDQARAGLQERAEAQRRARLAALLQGGQGALDREDFDAAMRAAQAMHAIDARSVDANRLSARVAAGLQARRNAARRQAACASAVAMAKDATTRQDYAAALRAAQEALTSDPASVEALVLRDRATAALEAQRVQAAEPGASPDAETARRGPWTAGGAANPRDDDDEMLPPTQVVSPSAERARSTEIGRAQTVAPDAGGAGGAAPAPAPPDSRAAARLPRVDAAPRGWPRWVAAVVVVAGLGLGLGSLLLREQSGSANTGERGEIQRLRDEARSAVVAARLDEAVRLFDAVLELDPTDAVARDERAGTLRRRDAKRLVEEGRQHVAAGRFPEAIAAFERALALEPANDAAPQGLEQARARLVPPPTAVPAGQPGAAVAAILREGDRLRRDREYDAAIERFESARRLDPSSPAVRQRLAEARQAKAKADQALAALLGTGRVLADTPAGGADRLFQQGVRAMEGGDFDAARRAFEDALKIEPTHARARTLLKTITGG